MTDLTEAKRLVEAARQSRYWFDLRQSEKWWHENGSTLIAAHEAALAMVRDLADELASELDGRYANMLDHPAMKHRYDRDMSTVVEARALLGDRS
jgi:hypothetical protein